MMETVNRDVSRFQEKEHVVNRENTEWEKGERGKEKMQEGKEEQEDK